MPPPGIAFHGSPVMKNHRRWSAFTLFLVAALAAANDPPVSIVIPGKILPTDARDKVRNLPGKVHAVRLTKDKTYMIDMASTAFDAYLRIEDSAGKQLAEDDDSGGNLNARIRFVAPKDDAFLIFATSFSGGGGDYMLTIKMVEK